MRAKGKWTARQPQNNMQILILYRLLNFFKRVTDSPNDYPLKICIIHLF